MQKNNGAPIGRSEPLCSQQVKRQERSHGDEAADWDECLLALLIAYVGTSLVSGPPYPNRPRGNRPHNSLTTWS